MDGQEYALSLPCTCSVALLKIRLAQAAQVPVDC